MMERLDKFLASAGYGTRSQVKTFLKQGRIRVNGQVMKDGSLKIDPNTDEILFDQGRVTASSDRYYMLHKPAGYITASRDRSAPVVLDLLPEDLRKDLIPVGRLDIDTEGLLLLTTDGALCHRLLSPRHHAVKVYEAVVSGMLSEDAAARFREGLDIGDEKKTLPAELSVTGCSSGADGEERTLVRIELREGRYHQVKRMIHAVGGHVEYLKRISMGGVVLDPRLEKGKYRELSTEEIETLKQI
ncbi:MAG: rRNA pseudouridine synthase [Lachnospiraceae bacterium]|nr:rRNA pseudouridine synthase [Lachnospiraceae bacterium]